MFVSKSEISVMNITMVSASMVVVE